MKAHFIAIGGSAMHNLALALCHKGLEITGSDDEIFEPSRGRLKQLGLLPESYGWYPEKITSNLDAVILGMHAREDNPELLKAKELGLPIYSYPEYLYEQAKNKKRVVIGGSHGKTTITSMILHVLKTLKMDFDYMVGANIEGFDTMVSLSDAPVAIFEGDEYLSSPIDRRPKFHLYHPHVAVISGIAWDHINVFPTFEGYVDQFQIFADMVEPNGDFIYFEEDKNLQSIAKKVRKDVKVCAYNALPHHVENGITYLETAQGNIKLSIFGLHNMQNLSVAKEVCHRIGVTDEQFYDSITSFGGAAKRLQTLAESEDSTIFLDFAHSPSKLKATTQAVKAQYGDRKLIACMELHTFSSLKADFLPQYEGSMDHADEAIVYFNPDVLKHKQLAPISAEQVKAGFGGKVDVFTDSDKLQEHLRGLSLKGHNLLLMSSGNFSGIDFKPFAESLITQKGES
ncbi:MAG: Mur ligase family protein [Bacteroidales bacterium]|jgi:UDP-N-acetylmuramate: L-alanyl-gamma-D-glutamyl-meso-diaminopimelate ligase|nr:Mur ligase family protein [Bacteroidales bacterium]